MTVDDVIERVLRRYLTPAFDQPISSKLTAIQPLAAATLTVEPFDTVEYTDAIAPGTIIEVGYELMTVTNVSGTDPIVFSVVRGAYGTPTVQHEVGEQVIVAPQFPRHDLWLAAQDEIEALHPDLWTTKTFVWDPDTDTLPVTMPADFVEFEAIELVDPYGQRHPLRQLRSYLREDGSTVLMLGSAVPRNLISVVYAARTIRPTDPSDVLADLNVLDRWADLVAMGVAVQSLVGQNTSDLRADYLTEIGETQVTESVNPQDVETALRRGRAFKLNEERRRIRANGRTWTHVRDPMGA